MMMLGTFAFSITMSADAKRLHDPEVETKIVERNSMSTESQSALKDRIAEILNSRLREREALGENQSTEKFSVMPTISAADPSIIGTPMASQRQCVKYLLQNNPNPNIAVSAEEIVSYYYEEGEREGIRPDVAFAQALKETGFFRFGGTVTPDQNNFCGLGTTSATIKGFYFPSPQIGVRAHIQHLLAYSSTRKPSLPLVDPRYFLVRKAYGNRTLAMWSDLNGRWAVPGNYYGQEILSMFNAILMQN
ncbi:MAG: glucosaminidase domain-containing protein [Selenomonadaceae bacterium]|nr:glucosaminidase domain-containing protein [Selenomonadaceae bacterium]